MAKYFGCVVIQRVVFPAFLAACSLFRPVGLSFLYLFMLFILPFVPVATPRTIKGRTGVYFKVLILISTLTSISHGIFEIIVQTQGEKFIERCGLTERILRHIGFVELTGLPVVSQILWVSPDLLMFVASVGFFLLLKSMSVKRVSPNSMSTTNTITDPSNQVESPANTSERDIIIQEQGDLHSVSEDEEPVYTQERMALVFGMAKLLAFVALLFAAVIRPSAPSAVYFLVYLIMGTWWAFYKQLGKGFAITCRCVMVYACLHIICFMLYQMPWPQELFPADELLPRVLGFVPLFVSTCNDAVMVQINCTDFGNMNFTQDIRILNFSEHAAVDEILNPVIILFCFYSMALVSSLLLGPQAQAIAEAYTRLMRRSTRKLKATVARIRDASVEEEDTIPLDEIGLLSKPTEQQEGPDLMETLTTFVENGAVFIFKNCYIFMNIAMMIWSIMYHSWLTFLLLIWANILWIIPNQRSTMLKSSPFVVIYAELLLIAQFLYGMHLPDDILPSRVDTKNINLVQIGFIKDPCLPCRHLLMKSIFTLMFWITLRQLAQERRQARQSSALADMVAPLQVTLGAAAADITPRADKDPKDERFFKKLIVFVNDLLIRFWIWIVVITLFVSGIAGKTMTVFRIGYMLLFLVFITMFHISRTAWKKFMYIFWLIVIIYAMVILVMLYTYQFENFNQFWEEQLHIPIKYQTDIGLVRYDTKDLFLHLSIPTIVVIMSVLQLHYFHNKFIQMIEPPRPNGIGALIQPPPQMIPPPSSSRRPEVIDEEDQAFKKKSFFRKIASISGFSKSELSSFFRSVQKKIIDLYELTLVFLELHLIKLVIFLGFWLSIKDPCVIHVSFVILTVIAALTRTAKQIFMSRVLSVIVGIFLLAKMVYQVTYIDPTQYNVKCDNVTNNTEPVEVNNIEWFGFSKIAEGSTLSGLLKMYIIYIAMVTVDVIIRLRQRIVRMLRGQPDERPSVLFPAVTRNDAEKDLWNMVKYLANYGFYKFGVEVCFIFTVIVIGLRMDIIAMLYAIWLSCIFYADRRKLSALWPAFQWFIALSIIVQYVLIVGAPPALCLHYPWEKGILKNLQMWAMLPDPSLRGMANKLVSEFFLLIFVTRQTLVFRIERQFSGANETVYPGGTNESVLDDIRGDSEKKFVNPTPDFTSVQRNWLDVLKNAVLLGSFWLALAIVFLTGANRVNLFSVGYLIGSFTFLWQGSDFYLRQIDVILKWWIRLIGYNVFVITLKTILQIPGCLFYEVLKSNCCWLIQLLSIVCVQQEKEQKPDITETCNVNADQASIVWDVVCFACLIIQYRVFQSHYFCHIISDTKASTILASRGAELIEELRSKQMQQEMEHERQILKKLKMKMDRIKATQQKIVAEEPKTHAAALRSGDYYMFEELDDKLELDLFNQTAPDDYVEDSTESKLAAKKKMSEDHGRNEPQASTSKGGGGGDPPKYRPSQLPPDYDYEEESIDESEAPEPRGIKFLWSFIEGAMISLIIRLNRISRHYRYVMRVLAREKIQLKKKPDFGSGRRARNMKWIPNSESTDSSTASDVVATTSPPPVPTAAIEEEEDEHEEAGTNQRGAGVSVNIEDPDTSTASATDSQEPGLAANYAALQQSLMKPKEDDPDQERRTSIVPEIRILAPSLERGLDEVPVQPKQPPTTTFVEPETKMRKERKFKVDEIEDFSEKEHSAFVELLMAIWFVILSNTDLVCYFMVFINQINSASLLALPLPFMVFCWGTLTIPRPSKTFWVTLIAYTQVVVLLKCICQFESLPWNLTLIPPNSPLHPARIIGIEKKKDYATYDLALLLILFLHRFMLKSLGLWKSDFKDEQPISEGLYVVKDNGMNGKANDAIRIQRVTGDPGEGTSDGRQLVEVSNVQDDQKIYLPVVKASVNRHISATKSFFGQLLDRSSRICADVYAYMFFCDFFNFMVVIFGFTAFGTQQGDGGVTAYLEENKVPLAFLVMLILQFALIIIDRALYLRKFLLGKVIFQYVLVVGIHTWMFLVLPKVTERSFNAKKPPVIWYMVKCIYLLFSAYQIRCGYPTRILGNFLTRSFSFFNSTAYKLYMIIPLLFEMRTLMDWIWTDTSMTLFDWLKMEDIFGNMYQLKCSRKFEEDFPAPRGTKKKTIVKYLMGGGMLFLLIMIIWSPLGLFALGNTVGEPNPPYDVKLSLKIGQYEPIYLSNAQGANIKQFGETDWDKLNDPYKQDRTAVTFLSNYEVKDVVAFKLGRNSTSIWSISPPDRGRMIEDVLSNNTITVFLRYEVTRKTYSKESQPTVMYESTFDLLPGDPNRRILRESLNGSSTESVEFPFLMPKFVKVKNSGTLKTIPQMVPAEFGEHAGDRNISLKLFELNGVRWWEIKEICTDSFAQKILSRIPMNDCESTIVLYSFNDKIFPPSLNWVTAGGIIGMYTTFVLLVSRLVRGFFSGSSQKIMFEDLPYVDRILQLCLDIYLVRESMEFALEEDLFAKLIFLYRSPETMIKWTRPKEEDATHPSISITATRRDDGDDGRGPEGAGIVPQQGGTGGGGDNDTTSVPTSTPSAVRRRNV